MMQLSGYVSIKKISAAFFMWLALCFVLVCVGVSGVYFVQPYGELNTRPVKEKGVTVRHVTLAEALSETSFPETATTYKILGSSSSDAERTAELIFSYLEADIAEVLPYDTCCVYYSADRTFCLWYYYEDRQFHITNFSYEIGEKIDVSSESGLRSFLTACDIHIPEEAEYTQTDTQKKLTVSFVTEDEICYDGTMTVSLTETGIDTIAFAVNRLRAYREETLCPVQTLARRIERGNFFCKLPLNEAVDTAYIKTIELVYERDSRNRYRPFYAVTAVFDGVEGEILIDATDR